MGEKREIILTKEIPEKIEGKYVTKREALIPILNSLKKNYKIIDTFTILRLAELLEISPSEVYGVLTFYSFLGKKSTGNFIVRLCKTLSCDFKDKEKVAEALKKSLNIDFGETTKDNLFSLEWTNCLGMCDLAPAMMINDWIFVKVTPESVKEIIDACRKNIKPTHFEIENFYNVQKRGKYNSLTFNEMRDKINLEKILNLPREQIIGEIRESGLRGRGGAGFPVGVKWNLAAAAISKEKYVVCNADEGEPGTFKDRVILMEWPELVIDGMTIAGYAIGAQKGIIYLRGEYTFLISKIEDLLNKRRTSGLLGKAILGKNEFSFEIEIRVGCGV
ncbi:MAG: NAD(P)H-dependent oxidoreductase subunit E, partial [Chitinispirillaceae bacterium]|nr:NAD(P)H-dependent oxidoreductase subunit E [Chitinispirillaceae bacterium]